MIATMPQPELSEQRILMRNVRWPQYDALVADSDDRHVRISFDQGVMELLSPSHRHEFVGRLIGRLVEVFTEVRDVEVRSAKSTTFRRADLERGFEADESYYIAHAAEMRGLNEIDLTRHPAPDLVIEVDLSHSSLRKFGIYGALGVGEVWLFDGTSLRAFVRRDDQQYDEVTESRALPDFPLSDVPKWLDDMQDRGETKAIKLFRAEQTLRQDDAAS